MRVGDWIEVASFPLVVQAAQVERLREGLERATAAPLPPGVEEALRGFVEQYFVADEATRSVVETLLTAFAERRGGAFLVRGVYGSGKSHLLGLLALLLEHPLSWEYFLRTHPEEEPLARRWLEGPPILVVLVALDEYPADAEPLEEILWRATERTLLRPRYDLPIALCSREHALHVIEEHLLPWHEEALNEFLRQCLGLKAPWRHLREADPETALAHALRFLEAQGIPLRLRQSRVEALGRLMEALPRRGLGGVAFLLDEVSLFLSQRSPSALQADAAFLQFLGQHTEHLPLWVVGTLQKNIEDVGDIEHYTLRQIKDRYHTRLTLSLAAAREVVDRKLIRKRDPERFATFAEELASHWRGTARSPTAERFAASYPLHPSTLDLLEVLAGGFLSRTRSVLEFVQTEARQRLEEDAFEVVLPHALFGHFARELGRDPALARYHALERWYAENAEALFGEEATLGLQVVHLLLVLRLAEREWTAAEIAAALLPATVEDRRQRVERILEILRQRGRHVDWHRQEGRPPTYFLDLDFDVNEALRRRIQGWLALLGPEDGRILEQTLQACRFQRFWLATFRRPSEVRLPWRNTLRTITLQVRDLTTLSPTEVANQWALRASPEGEERVLLWLATFFQPQKQRLHWQGVVRQGWERFQAEGGEERWRSALLAWLPRPLKPEEQEMLRLFTAHSLLSEDPELLEEKEGRRLLERLQEGQEARRRQVQEVVTAAYFEGEVLFADGVALSREALGACWGDWWAALQRAGERALERLFPRFAEVAPRRRLLQRAAVNEVINEFILPGAAKVPLSSALAGYLLDFAAPLGLVEGEEGDFRLHPPLEPLRAMVAGWLPPQGPQPLPLGEVEQRLAQSPFGLVPEQAQMLVAALVRQGWLTARDAQGNPLPPSALKAPLRAMVAALDGPEAVEEGVLRAVVERLAIWEGEALPVEATPVGQQRLWERLLHWREEWLRAAEALEPRLEALREAWGQDPLLWRRGLGLCEALRALGEAVPQGATAGEGLRRWQEEVKRTPLLEELASWPRWREEVHRCLQWPESTWHRWATLKEELENPLLGLPPGSPLEDLRERLQERMGRGDGALFDPDFPSLVEAFEGAYRAAYRAWHQQVHAPERFEPYLRLLDTLAFRLLQRCSLLPLGMVRDAAWVEAQVRTILALRCPGSGELAEGQRVCPLCQLPLGGDLSLGEGEPLPPVEEIREGISLGLQDFFLALHQPAREETIRRALGALAAGSPVRRSLEALLGFQGWLDERGLRQVETLLTPEVLRFLSTLLSTGAVALRRVQDLASQLAGRSLSKRQVRERVEAWLDPEQALDDDALIAFG